MFNKPNAFPRGWLAFELNVLRRLKFQTAALPFSGEANLGSYLKRWNVRVQANDLMQCAWTKAVAKIQNNADQLNETEIAIVLDEAYVPHYKLTNPALRNWFNETDSWWFDNVRQNIEKLSSPTAKAIALTLGMDVGDYAHSFDETTLELRQPLSNIYKRLAAAIPDPVNNGQNNTAANGLANHFIAENYTDLMFLRLPPIHNLSLKESLKFVAWREEWLRGSDEFWNELDAEQTGKLGSHVETKFQYLNLFEEFLKTASHIPLWAVSHIEDGFISTQDIVDVIGSIRKVDTIFTKDFSELTGTRAVLITA